MSRGIKSTIGLRCFYSRKVLVFVSLLFITTLVSSHLVSVFNNVSFSFALAASDKVVNNETELRNAINTATGATVIVLDRDIVLTEVLSISANKHIVLTSADADEFFRLVGVSNDNTIVVQNRGVLELASIIVTHAKDALGRGVFVDSGGILIMSGGTISNNTSIDSNGGGVLNMGHFSLSGGVISNNVAGDWGWCGGGVFNSGSFEMFGGEISGNTAYTGGGVGVAGSFSMFGGEISDNTATSWSGGGVYLYQHGIFNLTGGIISENRVYRGGGGGVCNFHGVFSMSGGVISDNTAVDCVGGGVANYGGEFSLSDGKISNNTAGIDGGGVWINGENGYKAFSMSGGVISGNTATDNGGGVYIHDDGREVGYVLSGGEISYNSAVKGGGVYYESIFNPYIRYHCFNMSDGVIYGNTAFQSGGGVYVRSDGAFSLSGGEISYNTAAFSGGGIWIDVNKLGNLSITDGAMFSNNRASAAYNRDPVHDELYRAHIADSVSWSAPFTQGYNNYDISYAFGAPLYYTVTVYNSYAGSTGAGSYSAEERVTVNAGVRDGYDFFGWSVIEGGVTLSNSPSVTFTMPANNVTVSANWVSTSSGGDPDGSTPSNPPSSSSPPSDSPSNPEQSNPPPSSDPSEGSEEPILGGYLVLVVASLGLIVGIVTTSLFFHLKKRQKGRTVEC